jgi:predicted SpoU family rRNA methylase
LALSSIRDVSETSQAIIANWGGDCCSKFDCNVSVEYEQWSDFISNMSHLPGFGVKTIGEHKSWSNFKNIPQFA